MNLARRVYGRPAKDCSGIRLPATVHVGLWAGERSILSLDLDLAPADARALAAELLAAADQAEATPAGTANASSGRVEGAAPAGRGPLTCEQDNTAPGGDERGGDGSSGQGGTDRRRRLR